MELIKGTKREVIYNFLNFKVNLDFEIFLGN